MTAILRESSMNQLTKEQRDYNLSISMAMREAILRFFEGEANEPLNSSRREARDLERRRRMGPTIIHVGAPTACVMELGR